MYHTSFQPSPGKLNLILKDLNPISWSRQLLYSMFSAVFLCKHFDTVHAVTLINTTFVSSQMKMTNGICSIFLPYTFNGSHNVLIQALTIIIQSSFPFTIW